ncbi:DUF6234 family protein [Streptomyces sp. NPDC017254]|uniref:DUF6234 family protein n=1 Tax=unclassified Streptomyces TaxID=2593676 RepID=UPI0037B4D83C
MTRHSMGSDRTGDHADRGADIGAGCGLLVLELALLVVIFGAWLLTGVSLDPAVPGRIDPLSGYLPWAGGVGLLAFGATVIAARAKAVITVISQGFMATLVAVVIAGGMAAQRHEDERDRPATERSDTVVGCRSGGDSAECARSGG